LLGIFSLLPYLKGWEYKSHTVLRTVQNGVAPLSLLSIDESGWLLLEVVVTDDAYGTFIIRYQGADLQTREDRLYPEAARVIRAFAQDPSGWLQAYIRPNPYSTAGLYYGCGFSGGFQGSAFPYVPTIVMSLYLDPRSTQASATVMGIAHVVAITDKKAFIHSLRRVLDANASLKIDPALLAIGPAQFEKEVKEK